MLSNNTKINDGVILNNAKDPAQGRRCMKALVATTGDLSPQRSAVYRPKVVYLP